MASARDALGPRVEAAREALGPRVEVARGAAAPRVASAVTAAQVAAARAAADLGPRMEAAQKIAQKTLMDDVVPRLGAAQTAALTYAAPRVVAAREAVTPVLDHARETLVAGVDSARSELEARRAELAASAAGSTRRARKSAKKARKNAVKKRGELETKALATAAQVKRKAGLQPTPRRWPWLLAALAVGSGVFVLLRRKNTAWTPAPAGDGPVPSYREDPMPSSPSDSGKTVSEAAAMPSDATPPDTDLGTQPGQQALGREVPGEAAEPSSTAPPVPGTPTAGPQGPAGTGSVDDGRDKA
jgi:hypothetical protein